MFAFVFDVPEANQQVKNNIKVSEKCENSTQYILTNFPKMRKYTANSA